MSCPHIHQIDMNGVALQLMAWEHSIRNSLWITIAQPVGEQISDENHQAPEIDRIIENQALIHTTNKILILTQFGMNERSVYIKYMEST